MIQVFRAGVLHLAMMLQDGVFGLLLSKAQAVHGYLEVKNLHYGYCTPV